MHQVPAAVWNAIAASQHLANPAMQTLMGLSQQELDEAMRWQAQLMEKAGQTDSVINAYQRVAPLLAEHQAISAYINQTDSLSLRSAMPEILTPAEGVAVANLEMPLSASEQQQLSALLQPLTPPLSSDASTPSEPHAA